MSILKKLKLKINEQKISKNLKMEKQFEDESRDYYYKILGVNRLKKTN